MKLYDANIPVLWTGIQEEYCLNY